MQKAIISGVLAAIYDVCNRLYSPFPAARQRAGAGIAIYY
jgi:hypothetical protein